jgi:hypothetical protein
MYTTDSTDELKNAIGLAKVRLSLNGQSLKEQLQVTYDSFRPANLIRSTFKEVTTSPLLISGLAVSILGLSTGILSKRIVIGSSASLIRKLLGNLLALGATKVISKNSEGIVSHGKSILRHLFRKRKTVS